jgi:ABC-2 type transport system ATP-binding protein
MILKVENAFKQYGKKAVLKNVSFELKNGLYGLLGPNGAGKTTLINIITGILPADNGSLYCDGSNIFSNRKTIDSFIGKIGYLPQYPKFYKDFKAREFLEYIAVLKDYPQEQVSERIDYLVHAIIKTSQKRNKI